MQESKSKSLLNDYGSLNNSIIVNNNDEDELTKSVDYYHNKKKDFKSRKKQPNLNKYKSDTVLDYLPASGFDNSGLSVFKRDSLRNILPDADDQEQDFNNNNIASTSSTRDDFSQTSTDIILSQTLCNCSYIVEPVAFIQNLATSIMGICLGQFIYNRILTRLINEFNKTNYQNFNLTYFSLRDDFNNSSSCQIVPPQNNTIPPHNNSSTSYFSILLNIIQKTSLVYSTSSTTQTHFTTNISPDDLDKIRIQAQSDTAHLYFISALFCGIPVILMTNLLGVNCSTLGRKTLMLIYLFVMTIKFCLILFQCIYPDWPDWIFYLGAFIEGISGSGGVFYLSLYCYIADLTSPSSRSYRITFLNNLNSIASLCVTFMCGYVIKYYGYFYLFLSSVVLMFISLVYTIFLIPEPLIELRDKNIFERLKLCSIKKTLNCFKVYFSKEKEKRRRERGDIDETSPLLGENQAQDENNNDVKLSKQTFVLLLIVFANFIYNFGTNGIGSIFTLFIMNAPFCFDSVQISYYSVFATVVSLVSSLFVSKFIKVNDLLICIVSVGSFFASVLCYIFGNQVYHVYLGALIGSLANLEYGYVRSIVSKSVEKNEVADALSLILIVDTFIAVVSSVIFPILYSSIVSKGISILFSFSNGFVLMALICHIVNYFLYKPVNHDLETQRKKVTNKEINKILKIKKRSTPRYISLSDENINNIENDLLIRTAKRMEPSSSRESINNPLHQSLVLS